MLTVIGEALVDVVSKHGQEPRAHAGGSPMNVAVGLARLGHEVQFLGRYGEDEYGTQVEAHLRDNGVLLPFGPDARPTSVAEAVIGDDGAATYDFQLDWSLDLSDEQLGELLRDTTLLHVGSIGAMLEPGASRVLHAVEQAHRSALISYDPNCRPSIIPDSSEARARAEQLVALADVVKASDEDLLWLYPHRSVEESAGAWLKAGAELVVVTRGPLGPWARTRATGPAGVQVPAARTTVVDTVGAGDSFMAALLAWLTDHGYTGAQARERIDNLDQEQVGELLRHAASAAGVTVSRAGADLPRKDELPAP
ncbi:carbohydrate kinase [Kocuria sp. CPCC 205292]|uniref:carbohydrate kinase family protein n=1 Tax=Kocuria cellulosilytica TaxID=3071451 RepID=UPI0034D61FF6